MTTTTTAWKAKSAFVSQLHVDGSGWDDCFEACLVRYLREVGKLPLAGVIAAQLADAALITRGVPDARANLPTTFGQADRAFAHYGVSAVWHDDFASAMGSPFALCYVNGMRLAPSQYPASWLNNQDYNDHFILCLPSTQYNDPLVPSRCDVSYGYSSAPEWFGGAYCLPAAPAPAPVVLPRYTVLQTCKLKRNPNHLEGVVGPLAQRAVVTATGGITPHWRQVQDGKLVGWVLQNNLALVR
jgi:hypothetical protein